MPERKRNVGSVDDSWTRQMLAISMVTLCVLGVAVFAGLAIGLATSTQRAATSRLVFASVLPLFGTWVGTVLAFYFARENLAAASKSVDDATKSAARLAGNLDPNLLVEEVMVRIENAKTIQLPQGGDVNSLPLADVRTGMGDYHRVPILSSKRLLLLVIHDSVIDAFEATAGASKGTATVGDLMAVPSHAALVNAVGFVMTGSPIRQAKVRLSQIPNCNDVFVTETGQSDGEVTGWLTNNLLAAVEAT